MKNIALELINYQNNDSFPIKLTAYIREIYRLIDSKEYTSNKSLVSKSSIIKDIDNLIKSRFNLNVISDSRLSKSLDAAIIPFLSDYLLGIKNRDKDTIKNVNMTGANKLYEYINKIQVEANKTFDEIDNKTGYVDLKNARVGGYLSEVKHYLIINYFKLKNYGILPEELTAIILHDIGHAFNGLETHHRLTTTNSTITDILNEINNNKIDKAYYIFKTKFKEKELEDAALGKDDNIKDFYSKLASSYIKKLDSHILNSKYNETNYENLSDSFATRFNVGKDLVSGLNKMNIKYWKAIYNNKFFYSILIFLDLLLSLSIISAHGLVGGIIGILILSLLFGVVISSSNMTYDFPIERYNRIKNGIINNLKNRDLPNELVIELLEHIEAIDNFIKRTDYFKPIYSIIGEYINPIAFNNNYYTKLQQNIENTLNNILFVKSAKLSVS